MVTSYPALEVTQHDVADIASPNIVDEAPKPTYTDATTIIVDKDEA
jgi:hypothetical protein